jgi:hypothetical protein
LKMASTAQTLANRSNAQRSTGPVSIEGKQNSRLNALAHGLSSKQVLLPHENREEYEQLRAELLREYRPANAQEETLVECVAQTYWRRQRAYAAETAFLAHRIEAQQQQNPDLEGDAAMALMFIDPAEMPRMRLIMRYVNSAERAYNKAVADLKKAQEERREAECEQADAEPISECLPSPQPTVGFVSQTAISSRSSAPKHLAES